MKRYIQSSYNVTGEPQLLSYIPKYYKKYVEHIQRGEKEWDENKHVWRVNIEVTWNVCGHILYDTYASASYMRDHLKEGFNEDLDRAIAEYDPENY